MNRENEKKRRFVLPYKGGVIGVTLSHKEIAMINRLQEEDPKKYGGTEGVFKALEEIGKQKK